MNFIHNDIRNKLLEYMVNHLLMLILNGKKCEKYNYMDHIYPFQCCIFNDDDYVSKIGENCRDMGMGILLWYYIMALFLFNVPISFKKLQKLAI